DLRRGRPDRAAGLRGRHGGRVRDARRRRPARRAPGRAVADASAPRRRRELDRRDEGQAGHRQLLGVVVRPVQGGGAGAAPGARADPQGRRDRPRRDRRRLESRLAEVRRGVQAPVPEPARRRRRARRGVRPHRRPRDVRHRPRGARLGDQPRPGRRPLLRRGAPGGDRV
ncbi:MAG: Cytochrome c-type biogenesis protein CcmG/DsbE, thiol:disulfide oxidoreductase, partial [uncultured Solirubrobacteraceae bacterium]